MKYLLIIIGLLLLPVVSGIEVGVGVLFYPSLSNVTYNTSKAFNVSSIVVGQRNVTLDTNVLNFSSSSDVTWALHVLDVYAMNAMTGVAMADYASFAEYEGYNFSSNVTNSSVSRLLLTNKTYEVHLVSDYENLSQSVVMDASKDLNFSVWFNSTTYFYFYDDDSGVLIDDRNVSLEIIGDYLSFNYSTENGSISDSIPVPDTYTLRYGAPGYNERTRQLSLSDVQFRNVSLYLSSATTNVTFTVYRGYQYVEGANIEIYRYLSLNNSYVFVGEVITNSEGKGQFDLTLGSEFYSFKVYDEDGVLRLSETPAYIYDTSKTFQFGQDDTEAEGVDLGRGIEYSFSPLSTVLDNETVYRFEFNLSSSYWNISDCTVTLRDEDSVLLSGSSGSSNSSWCTGFASFNTSGEDWVVIHGLVEYASTNLTYTQNYRVRSIYEGDYSLKSLLDDIGSFGLAGFNSFTRMMIAFIVIFALTIVASRYAGLTNPTAVIWLVWALVFAFSYVGWFTIEYPGLPDVANLQKYLILYLLTLLAVGFSIWREAT